MNRGMRHTAISIVNLQRALAVVAAASKEL